MSTENDLPKRRRLRFSLKALFLLVSAFAIWLGWNMHEANKRLEIEQYLRTMPNTWRKNNVPTPIMYGPPIKPWKSLPFMWRLFGVKSVQVLDLQDVSKDDKEHIRIWFPEAEIRE
jgi:hypothetical protein